ncbi:MAG TPA: Gfo/Idh/MocA family oxidoreductase [Oscillospiraceae bacterium]|nr:Gfo/Idh/MocA family oxidoreductase [Oscillospiraceae bacterium]HPS33980.1 Gfo/Idh/MocA family oxidoreductase [Oscillospiraceae bacterium]
MKKAKIGFLGCGNISGIYFKNLTQTFTNTEVYAAADLIHERVKTKTEEFHVPHIMTFEQMLECPEIDIILNITTPQSHYELSKRALEAGKNVYVEKPLSLTIEQGRELVELAEKKGLLLGGAPDTFMGAGIQTCRKFLDDGIIGKPIGACAFMVCHGHESWHPGPEFYYKTGGGPMLDMGPYYMTALVNLLGPVKAVAAMQNITFPTRTITSQPKFGTVVNVEVPTHVAGTMRFANDAIATVIMSFDVWASQLPRIEIYGTLGTIIVPDPNTFGGPVLVKTKNSPNFTEMPLTHPYAENSRGLGVSDMAQALEDGVKNRANCSLTNHVLEIMCGFGISGEPNKFYKLKSTCKRPAPLPCDPIPGGVK